MKSDLEKKIHAVEQTKLFNRSIMFGILTALFMIFFTSFVKPYFDGTARTAATTAAAQPATPATGAPPAGLPAITLPAHLGFYILGGGGLAAAGAIIAALIVRQRQE